MKKLMLIAVCLLTLSTACKKKSSTSTSVTPTATPGPNNITLNIGGKSYTVSGTNRSAIWSTGVKLPEVEFATSKTTSSTYIDFDVEKMQDVSVDYSLVIHAIGDGTSGLGKMHIAGTSELTENFTGGETYSIEGDMQVTKNDVNILEGTLQLTARNSNGTKNITGTFTGTNIER